MQVGQGEEQGFKSGSFSVAIMFAGTGLLFSDSHKGLMTRDRWSCFGTRSKLNDELVFCLHQRCCLYS